MPQIRLGSQFAISTIDFWKRFKFVKEIGRGSYGRVIVATDTKRAGEQVALKFIKTDSQADFEDVASELEIAQSVDSPYVAKLYNIYSVTPSVDTFDCNFIISMEYIQGPNLHEYAKDHAGEHLPAIAHDLINGTAAMHSKFVHRDIKALNVVLDMPDGKTLHRAVFVDFGLSCLKAACGLNALGTVISPDHARYILNQQADYDLLAQDIYCVGAVILQAVQGVFDRSCSWKEVLTCARGMLAQLARAVLLPVRLNAADQHTLRQLLIGMLQPTDAARMSIQKALSLVKRWGKQNAGAANVRPASKPNTPTPKPKSPQAAIDSNASRQAIIHAAGDCLSPADKRKNRKEMVAEMKRKCPERLGGGAKPGPAKVPSGVGKKTPRVAQINARSPRADILAAGEGCLEPKEKRKNRVQLIDIMRARCPEKLNDWHGLPRA